MAETRFGQSYLKKYDEMVASPKPIPETTKPSTKQPAEKQKEIWYAKALLKDKAEGSSTPYCFNVLAQLETSWPGSPFTSSETIKVNKINSERSFSWCWGIHGPDSGWTTRGRWRRCLHTSQHAPCIIFMPDNMQVKEKHDRPLYFTGYIGSFEVSRIQIDSGSALSIMPRRVIQHLGIPTHRLSATQTIIYGFNANGTRPMEKIKLKCQIGDWLRFYLHIKIWNFRT